MPVLIQLHAPRLLAHGALATLLVWLAVVHPFSAEERLSQPPLLEMDIASPQEGSLSVRLDEGHGLATHLPARLFEKLPASSEPIALSLPLPTGQVHALRISFFSTPAVTLSSLRLRLSDSLHAFNPRQITALPGTAGQLTGEQLALQSIKGGPLVVDLTLPKPLVLRDADDLGALDVFLTFLATFALLWLFEMLARRLISPGARERLQGWQGALWRGANLKPALTLGAAALFAAIVSCYPVVFCDRSFVAPANGAPLLYFGGPTIPGAPAEVPEDPRGADVAAMMWQNVPYSATEHRAFTQDGEWPLWNRYSSGGVPLLGQGLSMLGDPLHLLPLLTGGAAWAWDLKFLAAKTLFAFGLGLGAWLLTRQLGLALLLTLSSAWIGFFAFRFNHPAFFSVCYAPWLLLPWLAIRRAETWRAQAGWAATLMLADLMVLTSGAVKEPSMLLLCLNATGLLALFLERGGRRRLVILCGASGLFLLLSAPSWLVFLDALRQASTISDTPHAQQLQPGLLLALFDDIFSQDFTKLEHHTHPSLNLFIMAGVLWLAAAWRRTLVARVPLALALGTVLPFALVFGVVPPAWITALPFLGNLQHIDNVFGCVLLILLPLLAALGLADCWALRDRAEWLRTWRLALAIGAGVVLAYFGFTQAIPHHEVLAFKIHAPLHSRFYLAYAPAILACLALTPLALRWLRTPGARTAGLGLLFVCGLVLHFRHGMFVATKFDGYVMNPKTGMDLFAQSPALDRVTRRLAEPYRVYGLGYVLSPGYNALLGLEGLCGPDALMHRETRELFHAAHLPLDLDWRLRLDEATLPQFQPLLDALNLRYYLRDRSAPPPAGLQHVGTADLEILESRSAWPRAFFTDQVRTYRTVEEYLQMLQSGDGRPFAARQGDLPSAPPEATRAVIPAHTYRLTNNSTEFTIDAPAAGVVVLTENYEEGNFQVTLNGAPAAYFRVNHVHKGVPVPAAGTYRLRFTYRPRLWPLSLWISAAGLVLSAISLVTLRSISQRVALQKREAVPPCGEPSFSRSRGAFAP